MKKIWNLTDENNLKNYYIDSGSLTEQMKIEVKEKCQIKIQVTLHFTKICQSGWEEDLSLRKMVFIGHPNWQSQQHFVDWFKVLTTTQKCHSGVKYLKSIGQAVTHTYFKIQTFLDGYCADKMTIEEEKVSKKTWIINGFSVFPFEKDANVITLSWNNFNLMILVLQDWVSSLWSRTCNPFSCLKISSKTMSDISTVSRK